MSTCAPTVLWQDSGMFQYRIWQHDFRGGLGLALAHPLYHFIGIAVKNIPFGEFGYRVNLISALCGAITVANIYWCLVLLLRKHVSAIIGALSLGFSWTFWQHASIAEVYTLYTAIFSFELVLLVLYYQTTNIKILWLMLFINGLSVTNHMWGIIPLGCYALFAAYLLYEKELRIKHITIAFLCWGIGVFPYVCLIIEYYFTSHDIMHTIKSALFGELYGDDVLNTKMSLRVIKENVIFIFYNFATPNIVFIIFGIVYLRRRVKQYWHSLLLLSITFLFFVFAFRYTVPDRYAFFIPFYMCSALLIGVGVNQILIKYPAKIISLSLVIFTLMPIMVYAIVPKIAQIREVSLGVKREIPYRNDYAYFLTPWQGDNYGPEIFAKHALASVSEEGIIIADGTTLYPLWYTQVVKGISPSVKIIASHGDYQSPLPLPDDAELKQLMQSHDVYVVSPVKGYCPENLLLNYTFKSVGPIFKIAAKTE